MDRRADAEAEISDIKACFSYMHSQGIINDTLEHPDFTLELKSRRTWQYSPAVKALQKQEQETFIATQKETTFWIAKQNTDTDTSS